MSEAEPVQNNKLGKREMEHLPKQQRHSINAILNAVGTGQKRILIELATGTGKTATVANLLNVMKARGLFKHALVLTDRVALRDQLYNSVSQILGNNSNTLLVMDHPSRSADIVIATQKFASEQLSSAYPTDHFDLVLIYEAQSLSATHYAVLENNSSAIQVGVASTTPVGKAATFWGTSIYQYSTEDAIRDGLLRRAVHESLHDSSDGAFLAVSDSDFIVVENPPDPISGRPISDEQLQDSFTIFISYRRDDTLYEAEKMFEYLEQHFGKGKVFKDTASIRLGQDFVNAIYEAVGKCQVMLLLIGKNWLAGFGKSGKRRIDNPEDFVRKELETAFEQNIVVIPVLVRQAQMPASDELPTSIRWLARLQAFEVVHKEKYFEQEMEELSQCLNQILEQEARKLG